MTLFGRMMVFVSIMALIVSAVAFAGDDELPGDCGDDCSCEAAGVSGDWHSEGCTCESHSDADCCCSSDCEDDESCDCGADCDCDGDCDGDHGRNHEDGCGGGSHCGEAEEEYHGGCH